MNFQISVSPDLNTFISKYEAASLAEKKCRIWMT